MRPTAAALLMLVAGCYSVDTTPFENWDAGLTDATNDGGGEAPTVASTTPVHLASDAEPDGVITVTFSEAMAPETINATTFVVMRGSTPVEGQVSYEATGSIATFEPDTRLSLLGEYTATITAAVTDVDGISMESEHSWSFAVRDGIWGTAQLIETDNAGSAYNPDISIDPAGRAVVVWYQSDGAGVNSIWSNRYSPDGGWAIAELVETSSGSAQSSRVGIDADGNAIAVWQQTDGTRINILSNRSTPATGWGTPQLIETDNAGGAQAPQVAIDSVGNAVAVWQQDDGTRHNIWANRFILGVGWGAAQLIETNNSGGAGTPQVALDAGGNAVAAWYQHDGTRYSVWANRFVPGTGWSTAQLIETDAGDTGSPQVAVDASGNAIAVWTQSDGTRINVWANRFVPGTGWGTAQLIETEAGEASSPQVAVDAAGNAIAVWYQHDGVRYNVWANRFVLGSGWATAELVETNDTGSALSPSVAIHVDGNAIAVWRQTDGTRYNIWANRFVIGIGWGIAQLIETDNIGGASSPSLDVDALGNAVAVWTQSDGTRSNVWANTFR